MKSEYHIIKPPPFELIKDLDAEQFVLKWEEHMKEQVFPETINLPFINPLYDTETFRQVSKSFLKRLHPQTQSKIEHIPVTLYRATNKGACIAKPPSGKGEYIFLDYDTYLNLLFFIVLNLSDIKGRFETCLSMAMHTAYGLDHIFLPRMIDFLKEHPEPFLNEDIIEIFLVSMNFILAHEYSHFLLGHLQNTTNYTYQNSGLFDQWIHNPSQLHELEADDNAIKLLQEIYKGKEESLLNVWYATIFLFSYFDIVDYFIKNKIRKAGIIYNLQIKTHPSTIKRLARIESKLRSVIPPHIWNSSNEGIPFKAVFEQAPIIIRGYYTSSHIREMIEFMAENPNNYFNQSSTNQLAPDFNFIRNSVKREWLRILISSILTFVSLKGLFWFINYQNDPFIFSFTLSIFIAFIFRSSYTFTERVGIAVPSLTKKIDRKLTSRSVTLKGVAF